MLSETERMKKTFVAYEYKEVTVERKRASEYMDGYENFGWELDDAYESLAYTPCSPELEGAITLHMKRDRRIINKMELTRLQRQFEACMKEIQTLESSSELKATLGALLSGVIGLAFLFGATFISIASGAIVWISILLAIPGVVFCALALPAHKHVLQKRKTEVEPLVNAKYDEICALCEKGHRLSHV